MHLRVGVVFANGAGPSWFVCDAECLLAIRFVYFDLGNVLVAFDRDRGTRNLAERLGVGDADVNRWLHDEDLQVRYETGRVDDAAFCSALRQRCGMTREDVGDAAILDATSDMFVEIESMRGAIESVRHAGLGVGILSNTCRGHWDWIDRQRYPVLQTRRDVDVLSFEVGSMKPDGAIYAAAEDAAWRINGARPDEIAFMDDRAENIVAASDRSWHAVTTHGGWDAKAILKTWTHG